MLSNLKLILILFLVIFICASSSMAYSMIEEQRAESSVGRGRLHLRCSSEAEQGIGPALPVEGLPAGQAGDGLSPIIRKIQMPSAIENSMIGQATMMQEMMEIDVEILKLLREMARDEEMRVRIDKLITHYEEMLKKHQIIIEKMMR